MTTFLLHMRQKVVMRFDSRHLLNDRFGGSLKRFQFRPQFFFRLFFHPINKENALQVIGFVLDGSREQPATSKFDLFAFLVSRLHIDHVWPRDVGEDFGETQAAFRARYGFADRFDFGVYQNQRHEAVHIRRLAV